MTAETGTPPAVGRGPTIPDDKMAETIRHLAAEVNTYMREMPRLLAGRDGERYAPISGDKL